MVTFLMEQGYEINTVTEFGVINEHTSDINEALGLARGEDGRLHPTRQTHVDPTDRDTSGSLYVPAGALERSVPCFSATLRNLRPNTREGYHLQRGLHQNYVVHLADQTDPELRDAIVMWHRTLRRLPGEGDHRDIKVLGVRQGYTRCMCLPVADNSFIVSDESIARPLEAQGASVLRIREGSIKLNGFKHGFIGGTAGSIYVNVDEMIDQRAIVFNGDLTVHPDFAAITEFIRSRNILPVWFEDYALEDIGSILAVE